MCVCGRVCACVRACVRVRTRIWKCVCIIHIYIISLCVCACVVYLQLHKCCLYMFVHPWFKPKLIPSCLSGQLHACVIRRVALPRLLFNFPKLWLYCRGHTESYRWLSLAGLNMAQPRFRNFRWWGTPSRHEKSHTWESAESSWPWHTAAASASNLSIQLISPDITDRMPWLTWRNTYRHHISMATSHDSNWLYCVYWVYPLAIQHGNWKSSINAGCGGKIWEHPL